MQRLLTHLLEKLGYGYVRLYTVFSALSALVIPGLAVWVFSFSLDVTSAQLLRLLLVIEILAGVYAIWVFARERWILEQVRSWFTGARGPADTVSAWHAAVAAPFFIFRDMFRSILAIAAPWTVYAAIELDLRVTEAGTLLLGACLLVGYVAIMRALLTQIYLRPVVVVIARTMPRESRAQPPVLSLKWKLLAALPLVNVITGSVVAILSSEAERSGLEWLTTDVLVAVAVTFVISLVLTLMLSRTILVPMREVLDGQERVRRGDLQATVPVTTNDEVGQLTRGFNDMVIGLAERDRLREAFGSYVDPGVAERILEEGELLEGEDAEVTILFLDIRDFTRMVETLRARGAVKLINRLFEQIVPILANHGGHAVTYVGDGLMALFGAPERHTDHADRALAAAREIIASVEQGMAGDVHVGIGINSGRVLVGTVGGGGRLEFTAIGDAVNVASRVERATRDTGDAILLTGATKQLLSSSERLEPREPASFKGKEEAVSIYAPSLQVAA